MRSVFAEKLLISFGKAVECRDRAVVNYILMHSSKKDVVWFSRFSPRVILNAVHRMWLVFSSVTDEFCTVSTGLITTTNLYKKEEV
jgi:hypothetical protein